MGEGIRSRAARRRGPGGAPNGAEGAPTPAQGAKTQATREAALNDPEAPAATRSIEDFWATPAEGNKYLHVPSHKLWGKESLNGYLASQYGYAGRPKASAVCDEQRVVNQLTWAPGEPEVIEGKILSEGG